MSEGMNEWPNAFPETAHSLPPSKEDPGAEVPRLWVALIVLWVL